MNMRTLYTKPVFLVLIGVLALIVAFLHLTILSITKSIQSR